MDGRMLDPRIVDWIATTTGGRIERLERAIARREAWLVDVAVGDARAPLPLFLRIAHAGDPANSAEALEQETRVVRALADTDVPVPRVHAVLSEPRAVLFERVVGRSDLHTHPAEQQDAVYRHHLEVLGRLHALDVDRLGLDLRAPADARDCAMAEVDRLTTAIAGARPEPLARFGVAWLRRHAPPDVERVSLLHGDAGIANFLFEGDRITSLIDWEWAHLGDPMEDLGSLCVHASFSPSGDWPRLLPYYEKACGRPVDLAKVRYYRVHNLARSVLALAPIRARLDPRDPVALNQCFAILCDRMLCEAIADAMGIELARPVVPEPPSETTLYDIAVDNLTQDVLPHVQGEFPRDRLTMATLLIRTLARRHALGPGSDAADLETLGDVLGRRPDDLRQGQMALERRIAEDDGRHEEAILRALAALAYRAEAIAAPVVSLFGQTRLRPVV
ncbi:MAG: phosphotransferase family protein [Myxococcota bacterium]